MMNDLIDRQAAIDALCKACMLTSDYKKCEGYKPDSRWCEEITALREVPSAQPEPCKDAVRRADVVDMLEMYPFTEYGEYETAREVVKRLPPAQPEPSMEECACCALSKPERKKGKWIKHIDDLFPTESTIECNTCHHEQPLTIDDNYCPNCGAEMEG